MRLTRLLFVTAPVLLACQGSSGANAEPPEGFPVAWAYDDCAPWDGAALSVFLGTEVPTGASDPTLPYVRVTVYSRDLVPGSTVEWTEPYGQVGNAERCLTSGPCELATSARVSFVAPSGGEDFAGVVHVEFGAAPPTVGGFRATLLPRESFCGG